MQPTLLQEGYTKVHLYIVKKQQYKTPHTKGRNGQFFSPFLLQDTSNHRQPFFEKGPWKQCT